MSPSPAHRCCSADHLVCISPAPVLGSPANAAAVGTASASARTRRTSAPPRHRTFSAASFSNHRRRRCGSRRRCSGGGHLVTRCQLSVTLAQDSAVSSGECGEKQRLVPGEVFHCLTRLAISEEGPIAREADDPPRITPTPTSIELVIRLCPRFRCLHMRRTFVILTVLAAPIYTTQAFKFYVCRLVVGPSVSSPALDVAI